MIFFVSPKSLTKLFGHSDSISVELGMLVMNAVLPQAFAYSETF